MNRKLLAGAAALLLPASLLGVTAAGAKAKVSTTPKITAAAFSGQTPSVGYTETSTEIAPYQTATLTLTGSNLSALTASDITASIKGSGDYALLGSDFTVKSITSKTATQVVASVEGPTGTNVLYTAKGYEAGALTLAATIGTVAVKIPTKLTVQSNCGPTLPAIATAGDTYGTDANGNVNVAGGATGTSPGLDYFDVNIGTFGNLCSDDIGSATTVGFPTYDVNYPVQFAATDISATHVDGVSFSFTYTSARQLKVYGTTELFQLGKNYKAGACVTSGVTQPSGITVNPTSGCQISSKGVITLNATGETDYNSGDVISSPVFNLTSLVKKAGTTPITLTPISTTSEIGIGGSGTGACVLSGGTWTASAGSSGTAPVCIGIVFAPRAKSANASYAALSSN